MTDTAKEQERRVADRRAVVAKEDRGWQAQNLALAGDDARHSLGRRSSDYVGAEVSPVPPLERDDL